MRVNKEIGKVALSYPINFGKTLNIAAFDFGHKEWPHEKWIVPAKYEDVAKIFKGWGEPTQGLIKVSVLAPSNT